MTRPHQPGRTVPASPLGPLLLGSAPLQRPDPAEAEALDPGEILARPGTRILTVRAGRTPLETADPEAGDGEVTLESAPRMRLALGLPEDQPAWGLPAASADAFSRTDQSDAVPSGAAYPVDGLAVLGRRPDGSWLVLDHAAPGSPADEEAGDPWPEETAAGGGRRWYGLREAAPLLSPEEAGWLTSATALAGWHAEAGHCPHCGAPTVPAALGWARRCTAEGRELFPRTDPAVIVAVVHTDAAGTERILLGRSARWKGPMFSAFAGFVEAGESLEAAVAREVAEEAGVAVATAEYRGSQPWPFPRSLMVGFRATVLDPQPARADGEEIVEVRWFTRAELARAASSGEVTLPGEISIAHHLLADWYGGPLPVPPAAASPSPRASSPRASSR